MTDAALAGRNQSMGVREHLYPDVESLNEACAAAVAEALRAAIGARGAATLVVSGGRSPEPVFARLSREDLPWEAVWVTLADERWVPTDSEDSNERLVRRALLDGNAAGARFLGLKTAAATPEVAVADREAALARLPRPFDLVLLGMGEDGHTASLFPDAAETETALDPAGTSLCAAVRPLSAPHPRLSLTLPALLASRRIVLLISGAAKWQVYDRASRPGPVSELPIRAVLRQDVAATDIYWAP